MKSKKVELTEEELHLMLDNSYPLALEISRSKGLKDYLGISDFVSDVKENTEKYTKIKYTELLKYYVLYTQMICLSGIGNDLQKDYPAATSSKTIDANIEIYKGKIFEIMSKYSRDYDGKKTRYYEAVFFPHYKPNKK